MKKLAIVLASILVIYKRKTSVVSDQTNTDVSRKNI
ncbi:hypothetical protein FSAG_002301 [Fusobacterium periodonticum 2_1_31]|jgi:hypothetical protein|uniref:Uncharacterized protein n=1 Tax=Fusobacterium periodonticum 2_1_31 TaxID=469599 RepID=A0ABR4WI97_9FUSO|nr:hypothetical protein FSAG_002301 [Fusobacterium periodonticum 2_1_31]DAW38697.1 MAG TPA: hypothetical protein [Caudoviricetes sp.]DAX15608.1 MAG TPA: hypothetical protein [Caudoviricetes sp.]